jgi:hypothetical protein
MRASVHNTAPATHCPTWHELVHRLAVHLSWLHHSVPQTKASRIKIERWRKQLGIFPTTRATGHAQRGGQG